jgi:hypothetical protein
MSNNADPSIEHDQGEQDMNIDSSGIDARTTVLQHPESATATATSQQVAIPDAQSNLQRQLDQLKEYNRIAIQRYYESGATSLQGLISIRYANETHKPTHTHTERERAYGISLVLMAILDDMHRRMWDAYLVRCSAPVASVAQQTVAPATPSEQWAAFIVKHDPS